MKNLHFLINEYFYHFGRSIYLFLQKIKLLFFLFVNIFIFHQISSASHIIGGDLEYNIIEILDDSFTVEVKAAILINCEETAIDFLLSSMFTYIYRFDSDYEFHDTLRITKVDFDTLNNIVYPCLNLPINTCSFLARFTGNIKLPIPEYSESYKHYLIAFHSCCRTDNIANLLDSPDNGFTLFAKIYDSAIENLNSSSNIQLTNAPIICTFSENIYVETYDCNAKLYIPNVFSPNNDGFNDTFGPLGKDFEVITFRIFDRWGSILFESDSNNTFWDGRVDGKFLDAGVYIYSLSYREPLLMGDVLVESGTVTLVR